MTQGMFGCLERAPSSLFHAATDEDGRGTGAYVIQNANRRRNFVKMYRSGYLEYFHVFQARENESKMNVSSEEVCVRGILSPARDLAVFVYCEILKLVHHGHGLVVLSASHAK